MDTVPSADDNGTAGVEQPTDVEKMMSVNFQVEGLRTELIEHQQQSMLSMRKEFSTLLTATLAAHMANVNKQQQTHSQVVAKPPPQQLQNTQAGVAQGVTPTVVHPPVVITAGEQGRNVSGDADPTHQPSHNRSSDLELGVSRGNAVEGSVVKEPLAKKRKRDDDEVSIHLQEETYGEDDRRRRSNSRSRSRSRSNSTISTKSARSARTSTTRSPQRSGAGSHRHKSHSERSKSRMSKDKENISPRVVESTLSDNQEYWTRQVADYEEEAAVGPEVNSLVAGSAKVFWQKPLRSEKLEELKLECKIPSNYTFLNTKSVNTEIWSKGAAYTRTRDFELQQIQKLQGLSVGTVVKTMGILSDHLETLKKGENSPEVTADILNSALVALQGSTKLAGKANQLMMVLRRAGFKQHLPNL